MADDYDWADTEKQNWQVPEPEVPTPDEEAKKKAELLAMKAAPPVSVQPPQVAEPSARSTPPMEPPIPSGGVLSRLFPGAIPSFMPGAPKAIAPPPPPAGAQPEPVTPKDVDRIVQDVKKDEGEGTLPGSKAAPVSSEFQTSGVGPSRDVPVVQRTEYLAKIREPLRQEIENNPRLKLRVAALLSLENPGAGPAVVESMLNRAVYSGRSIDSITSLGPKSFYGPGRIRGLVEKKMAELERDPKQRDQLFGLINQAYSSNLIKGHTDQGSAGDPNYLAGGVGVNINRERFNDWGGGPGGIAGARRFREELMRVAGRPYLPDSEIAPFINPNPTALQKPELTGGLTDTPISAAQTAALMTGTPLEKIKAVSDVMKKAAYRGVASGEGGQTPRPVATPRGQVMPEAALPQAGSVTQTRPDMIQIPGMVRTIGTLPQSTITSPNVMSTAGAYLAQQDAQAPPPTPQGAGVTAAQPGLWDRVKSMISAATTPGGYVPDPVAEMKKRMDEMGTYNTTDFLKRLSEIDQQITKGGVSGVEQIPTNIFGGAVAPLAGAAGLLFDSPGLKQFAGQAAQVPESARQAILKANGIDPNNMPELMKQAESVGQVVSPSLPATAFNYAVQALAGKFVAPAADYMAKNYPIPSLITPAHAASVFGAPPVVINTPGGPVVMNDASLQGMVWGGVLTMGFGAGLSQTTRAVRMVRESPWLRNYTDPRRNVPGAPGTKAASLPEDLLKAGTTDSTQALLDIADRQARYERGLRVGIDPMASDYVQQKYRVQTGAGADNLIHNAIRNGNMVTDDFRFQVPNSIGEISNFAQVKPEFMVYMKAQMIYDQLVDNLRQRSALPVSSTRRANYPSHYTDVDGQRWDMNFARQTLQDLERNNQEFRPMQQEYRTNLAETRRFVTDGVHNLENDQLLTDHTIGKPSHPIFSTSKNSKTIIARVLDNDNPLRVAEDEMRFALSKQMKYDAEQHYMSMAVGDAFTPRTPEWVSRQGQVAQRNGAVLRRRLNGETVYYTADPLVVSIMNSGDVPMAAMGKFFSSAKDIFQTATTGVAAPQFATTGGLRAMEQGMITAPQGVRTETGWKVRPAGPVSTALAIPFQLTPRLLEAAVPSLQWFERKLQNTPLAHIIAPQYHNIISRTLHQAYANSFYKRMADAGAYTTGTLQQARDTHRAITKQKIDADPYSRTILDYLLRSSKRILYPLNESLRAVQEAPNFAWAYKAGKQGTPTITKGGRTRDMSDAELAMRMRDYTGDPSVKGFIWSKNMGGNPETLRYHGPGQTRANAYKRVGEAVHAARAAVPWSGVLISSPASTLAAMRDNPVRANMMVALTAVMPEMVAYMWNMQAGQGMQNPQQYIDYMMEGRNDQRVMNNIYVAKPGRPPWEGHEIPWYQEMIFTRAMTRAFMQQYYGRNMSNMWEDTVSALKGLAKGAIIPPQPSPMTAGLGAFGIVAPEGFAGDMYERRSNPYEGIAGGDSPTELALRGIAPSIADFALHAMAALETSPKDASVWDKTGSVFKETGKTIAKRTAIVRDVIGYQPNVSGSTPVTEEMYKKQHVIDDLEKRYRRWEKNAGATSMKGGSRTGMERAKPFLPPLPPNNGEKIPNVGLGLGEPKNPMYKLFMDQMEKNFATDAGSGYKSMWKNYSIWTDLIRKMRPVNEGNDTAWVKHQEANPGLMAYLSKNGINPRDQDAVRNFYTAKRNEVSAKILSTIRATEQKISKLPAVKQALGGKDFHIEDVDPDKQSF